MGVARLSFGLMSLERVFTHFTMSMRYQLLLDLIVFFKKVEKLASFVL